MSNISLCKRYVSQIFTWIAGLICCIAGVAWAAHQHWLSPYWNYQVLYFLRVWKIQPHQMVSVGIIVGFIAFGQMLLNVALRWTSAVVRTAIMPAAWATRSAEPAVEPGAVGLANLTNTCYAAACMQALAAIPTLSAYVLSDSWQQHVNKSNTHGTRGQILAAWQELLRRMWSGEEAWISPSTFWRRFTSARPVFADLAQQDAHEFLGALLDALHEDVNQAQRVRSASFDAPVYAMDGAVSPRPGTPRAAAAALSARTAPGTSALESRLQAESTREWQQYLTFNHSLVVDRVAGQLLSTTSCTKCGYVSPKFDTAFYLTLPIPAPRVHHSLIIMPELSLADARQHWKPPASSSKQSVSEQRQAVAWCPPALTTQLIAPRGSSALDCGAALPAIAAALGGDPCIEPGTAALVTCNTCLAAPLSPRAALPSNAGATVCMTPAGELGSAEQPWTMYIQHLGSTCGVHPGAEHAMSQGIFAWLNDVLTLAENSSERIPDLPAWWGPQTAAGPAPCWEVALKQSTVTTPVPGWADDWSACSSHDVQAMAHAACAALAAAAQSQLSAHLKFAVIFPGTQAWVDFPKQDMPMSEVGAGQDLRAVPQPATVNIAALWCGKSRQTSTERMDVLFWQEVEAQWEHATARAPECILAAAHARSPLTKWNSEGLRAWVRAQTVGLLWGKLADATKAAPSASNSERVMELVETVFDVLASALRAMDRQAMPAAPGMEWLWQSGQPLSPTGPALTQVELSHAGALSAGADSLVSTNWGVVAADDTVHAQARPLASSPMRSVRAVHIADCLEEFEKRTVLDIGNAWECGGCHQRVQASQQLQLWTAPDVLITVFKRFATGMHTAWSLSPGASKVSTPVHLTVSGLDLGQFVCSPASRANSPVYDLAAVTLHIGALNGGHYTALVRNAISGHWWHCDDELLSQVHDIEDELRIRASEVYMAVYLKRGEANSRGFKKLLRQVQALMPAPEEPDSSTASTLGQHEKLR